MGGNPPQKGPIPARLWTWGGDKNLLYDKGARFYIQKPVQFAKIKLVIYKAITLVGQVNGLQVPRDKFVIVA